MRRAWPRSSQGCPYIGHVAGHVLNRILKCLLFPGANLASLPVLSCGKYSRLATYPYKLRLWVCEKQTRRGESGFVARAPHTMPDQASSATAPADVLRRRIDCTFG